MDDRKFSHMEDLTVGEGEEHVAEALTQEVAGLGVGQGTDDRVPGRLLGRQAEYEKIGAEPYIIRSEFCWHGFEPCRTTLKMCTLFASDQTSLFLQTIPL